MTHLRFGSCLAAVLLLIQANQIPAQETGDAHDDDHRHEHHDHRLLEEVVVTASPLGRSSSELAQSATVLGADELNREAANNIGDTLARVPGLNNASFGQNVGRPVIRGQQGSRVGVLRDNMASADASAVSQDHAVPLEPFLADRIEVLRGASTLLYGSGAIGGVVNIVTDTIPESVPKHPFSGRLLLQGDTAADQRFAAARADFGHGDLAFHAGAFYRRTDDYEIPGAAELYPDEEHDDEEHGEDDHPEGEAVTGILENSFLDNEGGAVGASWIGSKWRAGMSWTGYDSDYGIPGAHAHHHEEEHGGEAHDEALMVEEEENVTIRLESRRLDFELAGADPFRGIEALSFKAASTDYTHTEFEGAAVGTTFDSETLDGRVELRHSPLGPWQGTLGGQYTDRDFSAVGEEAFVPPSSSETWALFLVESAEFSAWRIDIGLRLDDVTIATDAYDGGPGAAGPIQRRTFSPLSLSLGAVWHVTEHGHVAFNLGRAERAPADQELFAFGPHVATQTFEIGDPTLSIETNTHAEVAFSLHEGPVTGRLSVYRDDFDDYIYEADTGLEEDGLPVRVWSQQDAEFTGGELELRWDLGHTPSGHWQLFAFYDRVRAELADGRNVPRIPPQRLGLGFDWDHEAWAANLTWIHADDHTDTAEFETQTPGYDLLNAEIAFYVEIGGGTTLDFFLKGHNLLDEDIRNSTSFLKDQAPQIGRNFVFGVRSTF